MKKTNLWLPKVKGRRVVVLSVWLTNPSASLSHEYLLEMQMFGSHSNLLNQKLWGGLRKPSM